MPSPLFLIADPSLTDLRGHHYNLTRAVAASAEAAGFRTSWLVSADLSEDLGAQHPEAIPTFGRSMYDAYKGTKAPVARRGLLGRFMRNSGPKTAPPAPDLARSMAEGLREGLKKSGAGPDDHLLFHTADGATYRAVAALIAEDGAESLPQIHICTPYDPVGVMPNRGSAAEVAAPIHDWEEAGLIGSRIHLYAENEILARHLTELWEVEVAPLPLPVLEQDDISGEAANFRAEKLRVAPDSFVIISLGAARLEKGFNLFPDIIRRTFELAGSGEFPGTAPEKIHFALHASPQIIGRHPVIAATLEKLEALDPAKLTLLKEPLTDLDYRTLLGAADAVCLPYTPKDYRVRSSGIVTETIAAGKFLIATAGTYPGHVAESAHGGTGATPMEMARALLDAMSKREERQRLLDITAASYRHDNRVAAYVTRLKGV
ncbi:hypothetical protein [Parvularcula marina]|uniref:hypothetical protein n=1 Tax=Parvularcula marina TaxID=2292771 RepID=UPI003512D883